MAKRLTQNEFIERLISIYGNKYDYSKVNYINSYTKIEVICPEHGNFDIIPNNFVKGGGCPFCSKHPRINTNTFIERSSKIHNGRYDYSLVEYKRGNKPVKIICPVHGVFEQLPKNHLLGNGCPKCFGTPKSSSEEFVNKARKIYGDLYDYSKVEYKGNKDKVIVICPKHGEWLVSPNNHLRGSRCPGCYGTPKKTNTQFIEASKLIHGDVYDYSEVQYDGLNKLVTIICKEHGEFKCKAVSHLSGTGCPYCAGTKNENASIRKYPGKITKDIFLYRSRENHETKYDYSLVDFKNASEKVKISCPKHGEFIQTARYHMTGGNCPDCVGGKRLTRNQFIERANDIHKNKYDYSKVEYKGYSTKVTIICPVHGEFSQTPNNHLFGGNCPSCSQSNLEGQVREFLIRNNIKFEQEKSFEWLRYKKKMRLDFYLPEYNLAIECQGLQHFKPVDMFGGERFYSFTLIRDVLKKMLCSEHGIEIIYFSNANADYPYPVVETYQDLLNTILKKEQYK